MNSTISHKGRWFFLSIAKWETVDFFLTKVFGVFKVFVILGKKSILCRARCVQNTFPGSKAMPAFDLCCQHWEHCGFSQFLLHLLEESLNQNIKAKMWHIDPTRTSRDVETFQHVAWGALSCIDTIVAILSDCCGLWQSLKRLELKKLDMSENWINFSMFRIP